MSKSMGDNARRIRDNANPGGGAGADLRWDDLSVVLALARAGTLSGAAERLRVNISTAARRLDAIEERLGVHLFDRTTTGVGATELAEALVPVAESMERAAADAMRLLAGRETEPEGTVRISAPPGLASWVIAPALVRLRERHRKLAIELESSIGYVDLTRREADLAMRALRPQSGDLISVRLLEAAPVVAAAPRVAARLEKLADPDTIDWVTWGRDLAHLPEDAWIAKHVDPARVVLRTSSMDAQIQAVRAGLGVMLIHRPFLRATGLEELPVTPTLVERLHELPHGSLWLVGHRALRDVPRVRAVWDFVLEQFDRPSPNTPGTQP
jgi:DNA-binding transcriptional LysR family regulator